MHMFKNSPNAARMADTTSLKHQFERQSQDMKDLLSDMQALTKDLAKERDATDEQRAACEAAKVATREAEAKAVGLEERIAASEDRHVVEVRSTYHALSCSRHVARLPALMFRPTMGCAATAAGAGAQPAAGPASAAVVCQEATVHVDE